MFHQQGPPGSCPPPINARVPSRTSTEAAHPPAYRPGNANRGLLHVRPHVGILDPHVVGRVHRVHHPGSAACPTVVVRTTLLPSRLPHRRRRCRAASPSVHGRDEEVETESAAIKAGNDRMRHSNGTRAAASRAGGRPHDDGDKKQFGVGSPWMPPRPQPHESVLRGDPIAHAPCADQGGCLPCTNATAAAAVAMRPRLGRGG